jgi:hypothetical protein
MRTDYTRDKYGRRLPRRTRSGRTFGDCEDCGRGPARTIRFYSTGMEYRVCAQHEHEYCGTPKQRRENDEFGVATVVPVSWEIVSWPTYGVSA